MDTAMVYTKTDKGREEIEKRTNRLGARYRTALILVDGHSTAAELLDKIPGEGASILAELLKDGYIAAAAGTAPARPDAGPAVPEAAEQAGFDLTTAKREAVRVVEAVLGPGGEALALAIERSNTYSEFAKQAQRTRDIISQVGGAKKAAEFWSKTGLA